LTFNFDSASGLIELGFASVRLSTFNLTDFQLYRLSTLQTFDFTALLLS
jgi:hypothetical protein